MEKITSMLNDLENVIKNENLKIIGKEKIDYRYGYQQKNIKEYIDEISNLILDTSNDCKILYEKYIKAYIDVQTLLGVVNSDKDESKIKNFAKCEVMNKMGNCILKTIKQIRIDEAQEKKKEEYEQKKANYELRRFQSNLNWNKISEYNTRSTIKEIFYELSNLSISVSSKAKRLEKDYDDLSKAAKVEKAKMKANSDGFDWFEE